MPAKKVVHKKIVKKVVKKAAPKKMEEPQQKSDVNLKECEHCQGVGKCTVGEPYDKGRHQMFGSKMIMTSCMECLEAAGEHSNSKKIVQCRICKGTGKVEV